MKDFDIYRVDQKVDRAIKRLKNSNISEQDKALILNFKDYVSIMGVGKHRILRYLDSLRKMAEWLEVPFESATKDQSQPHIEKETLSKVFSCICKEATVSGYGTGKSVILMNGLRQRR